MPKDEFIALRVPGTLKRELQEIADAEERSLSKICLLLLRFALVEYRRKGAKVLHEALGARTELEED